MKTDVYDEKTKDVIKGIKQITDLKIQYWSCEERIFQKAQFYLEVGRRLTTLKLVMMKWRKIPGNF